MSDLDQARQDLQQLQDEMGRAVASASRRRKTTTAVLVILAMVMAGYLAYAFSEIAKTDARTVVALAEQQAEPVLYKPASAWAADLEAQAPGVIDQAADMAMKVPEAVTTLVLDLVDASLDEELPQLESEFQTLIDALILEAETAARENAADGQYTEAEAEALLTLVAAQFEDSLNREVDRIYGRYLDISGEMIDYLDLLATGGEALTEKQRLHRDVLVSFLALLKKTQTQSPDAPM